MGSCQSLAVEPQAHTGAKTHLSTAVAYLGSDSQMRLGRGKTGQKPNRCAFAIIRGPGCVVEKAASEVILKTPRTPAPALFPSL